MTDSKFTLDFIPILRKKRRELGFDLGSQEAFRIAVNRDIRILKPRKIRTNFRIQQNATHMDMGLGFPEF